MQSRNTTPLGLLGLLLVGLAPLLVGLAPLEANEQERHRWWHSEEVRTALGLTDAQSASLDDIYEETLPKQRESMDRLNAEQLTLSALISDMDVQEIDVTRQIDRAEAARSELNKSRSLMVFRMYRVLSAAQRETLDAWREQEDSKRRPNSRTRSKRR
jgi:Spy/CpxP family protein refolding chaperone